MTAQDNPISESQMAEAFRQRDRSWDGHFVVAVRTTHIYCRPSCPARRPKPENTRFYSSGEAARQAGYRPCKRCRPDDVARDRKAVMDAISWLRDAETAMSLDQLAERTGYSPSHLQKIFKTSIGLSPAAYARALRVERARAELSSGKSVSDAIYAAGFESPSRFYENMDGRLGMTPSIWRKGGEGMTIRWVEAPTTLGPVLIAASEKGVCRVAFHTPPEDLTRLFPKASIVEGDADFADLFQRVVAAVENPGRSHDIPLDVQGTVFQERIWAELCKIPPGETRSYGQLAAASDRPGASRAAGSANGANRIAVLIPCHRVIRADGSIGGYAFGEEIKRELLRRENSG